MSKLFFIRHVTGHHSSHSGYSRLLSHIPGEIVSEANSWVPYKIRKVIADSMDQHAGIYDSRSVQKEIALSSQMLKVRNGVAHFLNGERDVRYSTLLKNLRKWNFVATFHKPPEILRTTLTNTKFIKRLDGAIAVGPNQVEYLSGLIDTKAVSFIPHGVDTDFFSPGGPDWDSQSILFVGNHLRDFDMLENVVRRIETRFPKFNLHVVTDSVGARSLLKQSHVIAHSKVTDSDLVKLYRSSAALLVPLTDVTACNSILEAMACGVPVVTTQLPGHEGYLNGLCAFQVPKEKVEAMADATIGLMEDRVLNQRMRNAGREQSLKYSWPVVAGLIKQFYTTHFGLTFG